MKFIAINTLGEMELRETDGLKGYQNAVGGLIEHVNMARLPSPYSMLVNEEGRLHHQAMNLCGCYLYATDMHGEPIVGDIVITKDGMTEDGLDFVGMEEQEALRIGNMLQANTDGTFHWKDPEI